MILAAYTLLHVHSGMLLYRVRPLLTHQKVAGPDGPAPNTLCGLSWMGLNPIRDKHGTE